MTRFGPLLAASAALAVVLTACDGGDDPKPNYSSVTPTASATTSSSPTASPSPSVPTTGPNSSPGEVAPTLSQEASANTPEGAQAFAAYYFRMLDWSYAVNRSDIMAPLFSTNCDNCSKLTSNLETTFSRGTVTGTRIAIEQIATVTNDGRLGAQYAVDGVLEISAGVLTSADGQAPIPAEANTTITLWLSYAAGSFKVLSQAKV